MKNIIKSNDRKSIMHMVVFDFALIYIGLSLSGCISSFSPRMPNDFNFIAIYGSMKQNTVNTFNNTYTRTYDWDNDTIVPFALSDEQKELIYRKIKRFKIEEFPNTFEPKSNIEVSPSPTFYLKFKIKGFDKEIIWETNVYSKESNAKHLRSIFSEIENFVNQNKIIQELPEDVRGKF